ncbi:MAG: cation transporter [Dehalococcoidia bacterium]|nr:cation transporter [Dehalococcoidia bacterium]MYD29424.1 cation transporter [Dehalococcoidia bacterium]
MSSASGSAAGGHDHDAHDHDAHDEHDHHDHEAHAEHDHDAHDHHDHDEHDHDEHGHEGHDHHGHDHDHAHDLRGLSRRSLFFALVLISGYMVAEIIGGILSGSLALLADAGHMATDAAAIGLALLAMWIAERSASAERTFGFYRTEILAALLNAIALWIIVAWICFEAYHRFGAEGAHVDGWPVLWVGLGGLAVNIAAAFILHRSSEHSLNAEGAFQHVMADLLGSVGVVVSSILVITLGWHVADPVISIVIGLLILVSSWGLMTSVIHVLLEGTPDHIDVYKLCNDIEELEGVTLVHDVHAWTITSQSDAFTAHVLIDPSYGGDKDALLTAMKQIAHEEFGIAHITIQMEESVNGCDEDHHVDHLLQRSRIVGQRNTWGSLRYLLPGN